MSGLFEFPNPVNELAARTVAGVVLVVSIVTLALSLTVSDAWLWLTVPLAYGFVARVLTGPTLSPLGTVAMTLVAPRLGPAKPVPGPPKRFAQGIGAVVTLSAVGFLAAGVPGATQILLGGMIVAAGLESIFAYCVGCKIFAALMSIGWIPEEACEACRNVGERLENNLASASR
jgi:MFS family permease